MVGFLAFIDAKYSNPQYFKNYGNVCYMYVNVTITIHTIWKYYTQDIDHYHIHPILQCTLELTEHTDMILHVHVPQVNVTQLICRELCWKQRRFFCWQVGIWKLGVPQGNWTLLSGHFKRCNMVIACLEFNFCTSIPPPHHKTIETREIFSAKVPFNHIQTCNNDRNKAGIKNIKNYATTNQWQKRKTRRLPYICCIYVW